MAIEHSARRKELESTLKKHLVEQGWDYNICVVCDKRFKYEIRNMWSNGVKKWVVCDYCKIDYDKLSSIEEMKLVNKE